VESDHKTVNEDTRTRLIGKIDEIALAPESHDHFMVDREKHISPIASELQTLENAA
jgi:hypothetical protein